MSDQHVYDDEQAERLAAIYTAPATVDRRERMLELLDLEAGESVLSIGCGPGYEPEALAEAVGEGGQVHGIDNSEEVLAMAADHCEEYPQVTLEHANAADLAVEDDSFDAAVASLVYEYSPAVDQAVAELQRALRPGGRAALISTDWESTVWHSSDADRMDRAIEAFTDIYANPRLGSQLTSHLSGGGLTVEHVEPYSNLATDLDGYAGLILPLIKGQLEEDEAFEKSEVEAWERDLRVLDEAGETFFNLTYYLYIARNPG
ncbi:MAG: methyltransferase domain-containing protein [Halobacteriales archaeon]